jgi:CRISPR-associated protein Cas1
VVRSRRAFEAKKASGATRAVGDLNSTLYGPDHAGTVVVGGFGVSIHVSDGHLAVSTRDEGEQRFSRVNRFQRLVIVGTSGSVSLLALWWCREVDATVVVVETSGRLLTIAAPESRNDSRLRRAQATAPWTPAGLTLARDLNQSKLQGYLKVLGGLKPGDTVSKAVEATRRATAALEGTRSLAEVRKVEADCGASYHAALADVPMRWHDADRLPCHWLTLGSRTSIFGQGARSATTPGQALRNFLGGLASAEIAVACRTIGLDPGMGIGLHHDVRGRESLVWEVMEAVRPTLDQLNLDILASRVWRRGDFHELPNGEVRLRPDWPVLKPDFTARARSLVAEVTRLLHQALRRSEDVSHAVEHVAAVVAHHALETPDSIKITAINVPTVLSGARRKQARRTERHAASVEAALDSK